MSARFLVVDDFSTMRRVVRGLLRDMGFDSVDEAADGAAALAHLKASECDFVITDMSMPTMDGLALLQAIKADRKLRHLPVLMVTAEARKDEIVRCVQAGAVGTIVKPFARGVLEEKLRRSMPQLFASSESS